MKKIYTIIGAIAISMVSYAQTQKTFNSALSKPAKQFSYNPLLKKTNNQSAKVSASGNSGWFNYGDGAIALYTAASDLNSNYLFPDSMGYGEFGTGNFAPIWIHHLSEVIDFRSPVFSTNPKTSWVASAPATSSVSIDSMSIVYAYTRKHPNPNIVDTLIVTLYNNAVSANLGTSGFIGTTAANYGTDTISFKTMGYNQAGNFVAAPTATTGTQNPPAGQYKFKILLTQADTAEINYSEKVFALPVPFTSPVNKLTVGNVSFKPGYTYTLTQQIDATANAFFFASYEENGPGGTAGTFMNHIDCGFGSLACDYSMSYILPQDVRYNMAASWNYRFIPSIAYGQTYSFEHHLISFHLNDGPVGINELNGNDAVLGQNVPNPSNGESTVSYKLAKDVSSVVFTVTDVMGRVISSEKTSTTAGVHTVKLNSYSAGIYYYTINVDGKSATKKMIVQ